jgi:hypothetical protein
LESGRPAPPVRPTLCPYLCGANTHDRADGPVLSQTDLYLLQPELVLHPILTMSHPGFHLVFNLQTGQTGGFNPGARDEDLPFTAKEEPATLPRVQELILITENSPWCTIIKNEVRPRAAPRRIADGHRTARGDARRHLHDGLEGVRAVAIKG